MAHKSTFQLLILAFVGPFCSHVDPLKSNSEKQEAVQSIITTRSYFDIVSKYWVKYFYNSQKCIIFVASNKEITNIMDKQSILQYWASELLAVKMELEKIAFLLKADIKPTKEMEQHLNNMLDRKKKLEKLIEEIRKSK